MSRVVLGVTLVFLVGVGTLVGFLAGGGGVVTLGSASSAHASGETRSFADIVERVNPSVVSISVVDSNAANPHDDDYDEDDPDVELPRRGEGSGFVVDPEGYILTNSHLVSATSRIRVRLTDKREMPATLVGADPSTDIALVKVPARDLQAVTLGDSDQLRVGEWVCAIGNPYSFDHTVTAGVVSSKGRKIFNASFDSYIQTDAAINPGNSGGPLINGSGEAVGINTAVSLEGQGIGFAVPINVARDIMRQLRKTGRVSRGYLGVQLQELEPDLQKLLGLKEDRGAVVLEVIKGGAAEGAGLRRYDVITAISGQHIDDGDRLVRIVSATPPGSSVTLTVQRDGKQLSLVAKLRDRAADDLDDAPAAPASASPLPKGDALGLVPAELNRKMRRELQIPSDRAGVLVDEIVGLSPGLDTLANGDVIVEVNKQPTPDLAAYKRVLASLKPGEAAWLFVYRPHPRGSLLVKVDVEGAL